MSRKGPSDALSDARAAAHQLGGAGAAVALFRPGERGPCPACRGGADVAEVIVGEHVAREAGAPYAVVRGPGSVGLWRIGRPYLVGALRALRG